MQGEQPFPHQQYKPEPPSAAFEMTRATPQPAVGSEEYDRRLAAAGGMLCDANVSTIYLVHGTFTGNDAWGIIRQMARFAPQSAPWMKRLAKQSVDYVVGDYGNYSQPYADMLRKSFDLAGGNPIPVRLFHWSSENHHLGRADGAIRLIDELHRRYGDVSARIMLWGHSHAGNVFALMSNLLSATSPLRQQFFEAALPHYVRQSRPEEEMWWRVRKLLRSDGNPLEHLKIDCVTFGTPIRYGWTTTAIEGLLHYVYHRPSESVPPYRAKFPPTMEEVMRVAGGDYVQQFGIANTNFPPSILDWRSWTANRRLGRILQHQIRRRDLYEHLCAGKRVAEQGTTVLVDYGDLDQAIHRHIMGHAIYTHLEWLPFHAEDVCLRLYGLVP